MPSSLDSALARLYEFRSGFSEDVAYFGESTTHQLDGGEAEAFMEGSADDGNDDRYLYVYEVPAVPNEALEANGSSAPPDVDDGAREAEWRCQAAA